MKIKGLAVILIGIAIAGLLGKPFFVVDETEQVVVTQFGRVVGEPKTTPGLYFKHT